MHESFDPTPIRELSAEESPTPMWLPVLGVALLIAGASLWLARSGDDAPTAGGPAASATPVDGKAASPSGAKP